MNLEKILCDMDALDNCWKNMCLLKYGCFPKEIHISKVSYLLMCCYALVGSSYWYEPAVPIDIFYNAGFDEELLIYDEDGILIDGIFGGKIINEKIKDLS